ncbi:TetR/AcrR family transcriptional regulator [Candidatus Poriferisodalis sp.]|uniref:TetR/AcrR family transcriptional regulator n=1 Tax=Candidatus Poriferisodalis sp. TaxID=3101277 RepID=UPI003B019F76
MSESTTRPVGRPPKEDADGVPTRERLLRSAIAACIEHGFDGVTLTDVARRADVSTPAVYNHFASKRELLVEACRAQLYGLAGQQPVRPADPDLGIKTFLSPVFGDGRPAAGDPSRCLSNPDVAELLDDWISTRAQEWMEDTGMALADVKAAYILLMGLAHIDSLAALDVDRNEIVNRASEMLAAIYDHPNRQRMDSDQLP